MERGFETSNWWKMRVLGGKFDVFQKRSDTVGEFKKSVIPDPDPGSHKGEHLFWEILKRVQDDTE